METHRQYPHMKIPRIHLDVPPLSYLILINATNPMNMSDSLASTFSYVFEIRFGVILLIISCVYRKEQFFMHFSQDSSFLLMAIQ